METSDINVKKVPTLKVISIQGHGLAGEAIEQVIGALVAQVTRPENTENVVMVGPPMFIPQMDDLVSDFDPKTAVYEVAFPISGDPTSLDPEFEVHNIQKGKVLSMTCIGPYEEFSRDIYAKLFDYAGQEGYEITGPVREIYHSKPEETPREETETELQLPVA